MNNGGIVGVMGVWWLKTVDRVKVVTDPLRVVLQQLAVVMAPLYLYPCQFSRCIPFLDLLRSSPLLDPSFFVGCFCVHATIDNSESLVKIEWRHLLKCVLLGDFVYILINDSFYVNSLEACVTFHSEPHSLRPCQPNIFYSCKDSSTIWKSRGWHRSVLSSHSKLERT